jgi:RHS repeat-associated protein
VYWFHPDHLGSGSYITGVDGEVTQNIEYFPNGEVFVENHRNSNYSPYKFNGKELDAETGYYYYGARYYNPRVSLWLNVDPLADYNPFYNSEHYIDGQHNGGVYNSGNLNPYIFTYQNPIKFVDPNGKQNVATQKSLGDKIWDFLESMVDPEGDAIQYRRVSNGQKPLDGKDLSYAKQSRSLSGMKGINDLVLPDAIGVNIAGSIGYNLDMTQDFN